MTTVERDTIGPLSIYKNLLPNSRAYFKITHASAQEQTVAKNRNSAALSFINTSPMRFADSRGARLCSRRATSTLSEKEEAMPFSSDFIFAKGTTQSEWDFLAIPGNVPTTTPTWGYTTKTEGIDPRFKIGGALHGWFYGVVGTGGHAVDEGRKVGPDVNSYSDFAGVLGTGVFVTGVAGTSIFGPGVYGQTGEDPDSAMPRGFIGAVVGASNSLPGVIGWSTHEQGVIGLGYDSTGVGGRSVNSAGVTGASFNSVGVHGICEEGLDSGVVGMCGIEHMPGPKPLGLLPVAGVTGTTGLGGPTTFPGFSTTPGVFGTSGQQAGVVGTSNQLMGVYGFSTNNAGVVGQSANPNSFGGFFFGNVMVTGNLTVGGVISPNPKLAVMPFPDGTHRALYCMESPEVWFEDFGAAKLKRGRAIVKLDADFGKVIKRNDYRVFVTPEGDCRGLYIRRKRAASFEVRELAGGKSSVAFSYRIVARRKDIRGYTRFAKLDARFATIDTRLSLPAAATRPPRKRPPRSVELREFVARVEKEMREGAPKRKKSPPLPRGLTRPQMRPPLPFPDTEQT
jgi:hypothetical protein